MISPPGAMYNMGDDVDDGDDEDDENEEDEAVGGVECG